MTCNDKKLLIELKKVSINFWLLQQTKSMQNDKIKGLINKLFLSSDFIFDSLFSLPLSLFLSFFNIFTDFDNVFTGDWGLASIIGALSVNHELNNPHKVFISSSYNCLLK